MADDLYETSKNDGNQKFKMKKYEEALDSYTRALSINENGLLAYSNRAMCYINMRRFYEAKDDCGKAIALDPKFTKAYYRRAIANRELYRLRDAIADMKRVIELDPEFGPATKEMNHMQKQLEQDNRITMNVISKPPHLQSTLPMNCFQLLNQYSGTKCYK